MTARIVTMFLSVMLLVRCSDASTDSGNQNAGAVLPPGGGGDALVSTKLAAPPRPPVNRYAPLAGNYEFAQLVHANEMMPDDVSEVFDEISLFLANPGQALIDTILDQAFRGDKRGRAITAQGLEFAAGFAIFGLPDADLNGDYRVSFAELFNYSLLYLTPQEVKETFNLLHDVNSIINQLDVGGHMSIDTANADGSISGSYGLDTYMVRISFLQGCDALNTCCGRRVFSGEDMGLEPFFATFDGSAQVDRDGQGFDINLDPHTVSLAYGNILHFVAREVVFPEIAGTDNFADAIESLFGSYGGKEGCGAVQSFLGQYGLNTRDKKSGADLCRRALTTIGWQLEDIFDQLVFIGVDQANMQAQLTGRFESSYGDGVIDTLYGDGLWTVTLGDYAPDVSSEWRGSRVFEACDDATPCATGECTEVESVMNACEMQTICR